MADTEAFKTSLHDAIDAFVTKLDTFEALPTSSQNRTTRTDSIRCFQVMETSIKENTPVVFGENESFHQAYLAGKLPHQLSGEYLAIKKIVDEFRANYADLDIAELINDVCYDFYQANNNNGNANSVSGGARSRRNRRNSRNSRSSRRNSRSSRRNSRSSRRNRRSSRRN